MAYEIRVDCPSCSIEGARIETWETEASCCRLGVPEIVRCRFCGHTAEGRVVSTSNVDFGVGCPGCGAELDDTIRDACRCPYCGAHAVLETLHTPRTLGSLTEVEVALDAWGREEGLASSRELIDTYFSLPSAAEIVLAMQRGEPIETTFDVADYLFSGGGAGGATAGEPVIMRERDAPATVRRSMPHSIHPVGGAREELLAIASVAAADGEASIDDQAVLARAAQKRGLTPLAPEDIRVWRPNEIGPPATLLDRERVLQEMFQMGWADGQMDESELRVIRDFSRAWGIDPERLRRWAELYSFGDANRFERWFRRIGLFLFPAS